MFVFVLFCCFVLFLVETGILKYEGVATTEDVFQFRFPEITFENFFIS